ncbi:hypothetical protein MKX03_015943 [Papaver bracteatum]|nr:hypothetical protein MKX03_015943 [Papaver bracteatum]
MDNKLVICEVFKAREVFKLPEQEIVSFANACVNDGYRFEFDLIAEDFCQQEFQTLDEIFKYACSSSSSKGGKALEPSKDVIKTDLFMHQKYGLGWLYHRENSYELPPFWVENKQRGSYKHLLTKIHTNQRPEPLRGGIFADDMGLGKTLTLLSLISTDFCAPLQSLSENLRKEEEEEEDELTLSLSLAGKRTSDTKKRKYSREIVDSSHTKKVKKIVDFSNLFPDEEEDEIIPKGWWGTRRKTLIICPQSHLSDWTKQLDQHTKPGILKALTYAPDWRKPGRNINSSDNENFQEYDVVLTTDETLVHQSLVPFKDIEWHRVILDEAHLVYTKENYRRAASALKFRLETVPFLKTKIVWLVTGMPILNGSYNLLFTMDLLRFEPFSDAKYWQVLVQKLLDKGCKNGISRLQDLTSNICLRRLKEDGKVKLMPKTVETCFVDFSDEEREEYDQVEADSQNVVRNYMNHGRIVGNYASMLGIIQRLRQLCNHFASCPTETLSAYTIEDVTRNPELLQKMVSTLQDEDCFDCPICISPLCNATITSCAHVFCEKCILKYLLTKQKKKKNPCCPMCRHPLSKTDLFSGSPGNPCNGSEDNGFAISTSGGSGTTIYSSKVSALLNLLVASKNGNMSTKSVVFSQFRKMLILLEEPLKAAGFEVVRLDDHMKSTRKRNQLVEEFENMNSANSHIVLLADHKASNTCINLTFATRAYLLEPWCNPIVEDQAINRLHRIGRQQEIKITRLITKNSIEERIMQLHEWKKNLRSESSAENMDKRQIHREEFRILMAL